MVPPPSGRRCVDRCSCGWSTCAWSFIRFADAARWRGRTKRAAKVYFGRPRSVQRDLAASCQVAIGRRDEPYVDGARAQAADACHFARLDDVQQRGLHRPGELSDFVEKRGTAIGGFDEARLGRHGARESAALMTKDLALEERLRERGAIDAHERRIPSRRLTMNGLGDEVLSNARLAKDEDADRYLGHAVNRRIESFHEGIVDDRRIVPLERCRVVIRFPAYVRSTRLDALHEQKRAPDGDRLARTKRMHDPRRDGCVSHAGTIGALAVLDGQGPHVKPHVVSRRQRVAQAHVAVLGAADDEGA